jgi:NAD(P)H dehydrogenase (quinone)
MKTLIIIAHPSKNSFNASILYEVEMHLTNKGHEVKVCDLYTLKFNPVLEEDNHTNFSQNKITEEIMEEQKKILWAENLVFIYPTWWCGMPAILKGYFDRVFTNGFAFRYEHLKGAEGLLKGKKCVVFQTTSQTEDYMKPNQLISSMETSMDVGILDYCGINVITHKFFYSVPNVDKEAREKMLKEVKSIVDIL